MRDVSATLRSGYLGNLSILPSIQLLAGLSTPEAAALCFVSPHTYRRWLRDRQPNPMAVRLLSIVAGYMPWQGWESWEVHGGRMFPPGYTRHGIAPADIYNLPFTHQLLGEYRRIAEAAKAAEKAEASVLASVFPLRSASED